MFDGLNGVTEHTAIGHRRVMRIAMVDVSVFVVRGVLGNGDVQKRNDARGAVCIGQSG